MLTNDAAIKLEIDLDSDGYGSPGAELQIVKAPARTRAREDLTVQVKLTRTGVWHRKLIGGGSTACGRPLGGYAVRDESYEGDLCRDGCFSAYEVAIAPPPPSPVYPTSKGNP